MTGSARSTGTGAAPLASALYLGRVSHQRLRPMKHRLAYRVFSLLVDIDELPRLDRELRVFSLNRFNLFSLHERDFGASDGRSLRRYVDDQLGRAGLQTGGAIQLLTMPRILGYAFNPISIWFCHRPDGGLDAVLYEVNNTFGDRHTYLIRVEPDQAGKVVRQGCAKQLHVSPFLGLAMNYRFRIEAPSPAAPRLSIAVTAFDDAGPVLAALQVAHRTALSDRALLGAFFTHPLLTLKVVGAIHFEALRLWIKGARFHRRPDPPSQTITIVPKS
ncbi:DUF1365 domain-containing protein [soil metagenome]